MSYGLAAGRPDPADYSQPRDQAAVARASVLVVVLLGGFTTNLIWCVILNIRNGSGHEYFAPPTGWNYFSARWPVPSGISNSSSTRWARPRWEFIVLQLTLHMASNHHLQFAVGHRA